VISLLAIGASFVLTGDLRFRYFGIGVLSGSSLAGLFVGSSNLNIVVNQSSFQVLGLDASVIGAGIIVLFAAGGMVYGGIRKVLWPVVQAV
jgi:hypothetical protein